MRSGRRAALVIVLALLATACGGSGDDTELAAGIDGADVGGEGGPAETTREVTQVVVVGADVEAVDAIRSVLGNYEPGPVLEQVVFLAAPSCDETEDALIVCQGEPEALEPTTGRRSIVVLDGDLGLAAEAAEVVGGPLTMVVAGEPDEAAAALLDLGSAVIFVPAGLSELVVDPVVAFLLGVNDELAAFDPVVVGGEPARQTSRFFDDRIADMTLELPETVATDDPLPEPDVRWVLDLPEPTTNLGLHERAVVVDGVVAFLGNDGLVRGVDTDDGTVLWSREIDAGTFTMAESFVSAAGSTLFVSGGFAGPAGQPLGTDPDLNAPDRSLWALDVRNGDPIWSLKVPPVGVIGHPATDGERVFVWVAEDEADISLRALDIVDGTELWREDSDSIGAGPPRVDNGQVWAGAGDGSLRGFDAATGEELVQFDGVGLGVNGVASRPAVTADRVFFGSDNGTFYAIDRTSGDAIWAFSTDSTNLPSSPVIADDLVIFGSFDGGVYGLDSNSGELRWRFDGGGNALFLSSAAFVDDAVYIASFNSPSSLFAIDTRTGDGIWELPIGRQLTSASPFIDGDTIYIQTPGKLWAITR